MLDTIFSKTVGKLSAALGCAALAFCVGFAGWWSRTPGPNVTAENCKAELGTPAATAADTSGRLRIVGVWPEARTINRHVCLAVAGAAAKADATNANASAAPVALTLFFDGRRASQMTFKALAIPDVQYIIVDLVVPSDATSPGAIFWRELLAGPTQDGVKELSVGLSRTASDNPEAEAAKTLKLRIYYPWVFGIGTAAMVLLSLAFCVLARYSTILRDNDKTRQVDPDFTKALDNARANERAARAASENAPADQALKVAYAAAVKAAADLAAKAGEPTGPYSLGRTQMALWLVLTITGFIFIWLTLGEFLNVVTASVLVLLGINGATGLAAVQMNGPADETSKTQSFFADILQDGAGAKLQRIQVAAWTVILATIFIWNAVTGFQFVAFDNNLLILMGLANSLDVGFKYTEK
jgi:hypothetical protein